MLKCGRNIIELVESICVDLRNHLSFFYIIETYVTII